MYPPFCGMLLASSPVMSAMGRCTVSGSSSMSTITQPTPPSPPPLPTRTPSSKPYGPPVTQK